MGEYERHPEAARWLRNIIDGFQPYVQQTTDLRTKAEDVRLSNPPSCLFVTRIDGLQFRNYLITFEAQGEKFYPLVDWRNDVVKCTEGIHPVVSIDMRQFYRMTSTYINSSIGMMLTSTVESRKRVNRPSIPVRFCQSDVC
jgi:hypothetical protein